MTKKTKLWLILGIFITIFLSGCICTAGATESFLITPDSPIDVVITTLNPTFSWTDNKTCDPNKFRIRIEENVLSGSFWFDDYVGHDDLPFTLPGASLLPGRQYNWKVMAVKDYVSPESPSAQSAFSETVSFFTGPVCSGETLVAPTLEFPNWGASDELDDWINHGGIQEFHWSYTGGCLPISYDYQFATDIGFTSIVLSGSTTEPYVQSIYETFPNCSSMFWRVRANDGTSVGPWSDGWQFHWVEDDTCWQNRYVSDDAARINVRIYHDQCAYTGDPAGMRLSSTGCKLDKNGVTLVGDGERTFPPDSHLSGVEVDLGSGPCPSTGLDHKTTGGYIFNVLAPGTYCVSVTRNQIVDYGSTNLMHGIWTDPRINEHVAYKTIDIGLGTSDVNVYFGWDEYDHFIVMPRLPETKYCRICPDPIGPVVDILMEESLVELFGRDMNSEWKSTYAKGVPCYLWLMDEKINLELSQFEDFDWRAEDLEFYSQPAPCPKPEPKPGPDPGPESQPPSCSDYATREECSAHSADSCKWNNNTGSCDGP